MDSKGQASNVFNLLISAIVALAVLVVLLGILGYLPILPTGVPSKEAANQLKDAYGAPATVKISPNVTFNQSESNINSTAIAKTSTVGISAEQVCLSMGDIIDDKLFTINEGMSSINYTGSASKATRISAFCYTGKEIKEKLTEIGSGMKSEWADSCPCASSDFEETCCLVALRFQST